MSKFYLNPNADNEQIIRNIGKTIRELDKGKRWEVGIKQYRRSRSQLQLGYWWSTVLPCIKVWLHESRGVAATEKGIHEEIKELYIPTSFEQGMRGEQKVYKSTGDLTAVEFAELCTKVAADFADQGLYIPPPDKNWKQNRSKAA